MAHVSRPKFNAESKSVNHKSLATMYFSESEIYFTISQCIYISQVSSSNFYAEFESGNQKCLPVMIYWTSECGADGLGFIYIIILYMFILIIHIPI